MGAEQTTGDGPLVPMPPLTPTALRRAVAQIAPAQLAAFRDHLEEAAEQAASSSSTAPLRSFLRYWGEFVAVQRHPARAARLRELENTAQNATDPAAARAALAGVREIMAQAQREVHA
ncbi:hypothetical protein [Streptomyces sp. ICBB 8177]|uniref:hypothetical protein n=1 Tax=Streptomyces sp. ICBB 8177 TaxID=563922 RepID=UPI000D67C08D|nr:hypothetical protein [Streptomyces sp. ICBB 8177]PWI43803.1 hypothetical protein CK485_17075 [Streptomyces sp. ICBB 8177]